MKKETTRLIIFFIIWIFISILVVQLGFHHQFSLEEGTSFIPGNKDFDSIVIVVIYPLFLILIYVLISPLLALVFLKLHKILKFNRYSYGILKREEENLSTLTLIWRFLIASLFTFSIASILYLSFIKDPFIIVATSQPETAFIYIMMLSLIIYPFILLILAPIWLMQDSCLMTAQKKFKKGRRQLPDIEGVHSIYQRFIYGYVGITTIISMILLYTEFLMKHETFEIFDIIAPFMLILLLSFPVALYDLFFKKSSKRFNKMLSKKGILLVNSVEEI